MMAGLTRRGFVNAAITISLANNAIARGTGGAGPAPFPVGLFADLSSPVIPAGINIVRTQGYHRPGEGSADYLRDEAIDDGYLSRHRLSAFVAADGRRFRLRADSATDARALGLRPGLDGGFAAANRQAIADMLDLGLTVRLPPGDIDLVGTAPITLPSRNGIVVAGSGWTTKLVTSDTAFQLPTLSRLEIRDLWIEQTRTGGAPIQSFHANLRGIRLLRLKITMRDQAECRSNCISLVMDASPMSADGLAGLCGLLIEDCWLAPGRMGIEIQNHRIGDNVHKLYAYQDVTIRGCTISKAPALAGMGVSLTGWGTGCLISRNHFIACHGPSVEIVGSDRTTVIDNVFEDAIGPVVTASNDRVVSGCRILRNRTTGKPPAIVLFLQAVDGAEVANNMLGTTGVAIIKGSKV